MNLQCKQIFIKQLFLVSSPSLQTFQLLVILSSYAFFSVLMMKINVSVNST